ncbi:MAG TPA: hypothetical protein VNJ08_08135 [Bacteriovoracaceae bacterium]|nr:hypothetical protein [Bacteriovoracaceae bacterium]
MKWLLLLLFSLTPLESFALDYPYVMRSPRGLLMGDAFTAVNDDDYTLFYNPASLARHKSDLSLYLFNGSLMGTNVLSDLDKFDDIPEEPVGMADLLLDYPVHASAGVAPGFKLFNFGITFIANESYDLLLRNRAHPMLDVDIRSDKGVIFGVGIPIGPNRINKKSKSGMQTSFGLGAKFIERTGVSDSLALVGPTVLDSLGKDDMGDLVNSLGRVKGTGWGFDAGLEHVVRTGNSQFIVGLSALDITGTDFKVENNPYDLKVASNRDQVNLGFAAGQDLKLFDFIFSADIRALNEEMDFGKRLRFGAQVGLPILKLMAGVNSGYYSYGATLDLFFMKVTGGFYDLEIGSNYGQTKSKRFVIYLSLFDFSFDA